MQGRLVLVSFLTVVAAGVGVARADVPPPDSCTSPGQPCQNGGPSYDQAGTCVAATCTKSVPAADGGRMSLSYACHLCQPGGGGGGAGGAATGGAGGAATGGAATGGAAGSAATGGTASGGTTAGSGGVAVDGSLKSSSGCAIAPGDRGEPAGLALLVAIGLAAVLRRRHAAP
jgi:MYXO-CTERM domain-containing protein